MRLEKKQRYNELLQRKLFAYNLRNIDRETRRKELYKMLKTQQMQKDITHIMFKLKNRRMI